MSHSFKLGERWRTTPSESQFQLGERWRTTSSESQLQVR